MKILVSVVISMFICFICFVITAILHDVTAVIITASLTLILQLWIMIILAREVMKKEIIIEDVKSKFK